MGKNENTPAPNYMYSTASEDVEAQRLETLNELHNPHSLGFIAPYAAHSKRILELGPGSGQLAFQVLSVANEMKEYIGIDKDLAQIQKTREKLSSFNNRIKLIQLDLITGINQLEELGKFDLIYCRWVLVHLPKSEIVNILSVVLNLLTPEGVFICDECDNRNVSFKQKTDTPATAPYREANEAWARISQALMNMLGNDLELTSEKIANLLKSTNVAGQINIEGQYQVTLSSFPEKSVIPAGYRSSQATLFKALNQPIEPLINTFSRCAEDPELKADFLTENVISFRRS